MGRVLRNKDRLLLEDMGFQTHKIEKRAKRSRDLKMKSKNGKKRFYNA